MDQVKQILAVLKKQHFWVLSGVLVLAGLGTWLMASGKLADQYLQRENKLNSQRKEVQKIASEQTPNQQVIDAIKKAHKGLKDEVFRAWTLLYQVQKDNNPWPRVLSQDFVDAASALKPGENYLKVGEEFKEPKYLEEYQYFIMNHLPKLGVIIDVREPKSARELRLKPKEERRTFREKKKPDKKGGGGAGKAKADAEEPAEEEIVGKVIWDEGNQAMIYQKFDWDAQPTTLQVLIAQEDLWVYEALLRIIRDTNEGLNSYYKVPVKQVISLEIGREAAAALGGGRSSTGSMQGMGPMYPSGGPGMPGSPGMPSGSSMAGPASGPGMPAGPGTPGTGGQAGTTLSPQEMAAQGLLDSRYVDQKGKPVTYGSEPPSPKFVKMMPVRMVLFVDQRRLPKLLAQCANSSMPVDVTRVVLRPDQFQAVSSGGSPGGMSSPGMAGMPGGSSSGMPGGSPSMPASSPPMYGSRGAGMPSSAMSSPRAVKSGSSRSGEYGMSASGPSMPGSTAPVEEENPWDMEVEIQGIIYIFTPPDRSNFDTGGEGQTSAEGATTGQPVGAAQSATPPAAPGKAAGEAEGKAAATPEGKAADETEGKKAPEGKAPAAPEGKAAATPEDKAAGETEGKKAPEGKTPAAPEGKAAATPEDKAAGETEGKKAPEGKTPAAPEGKTPAAPEGKAAAAPAEAPPAAKK
jgi:hypothetical protein